MTLEQLAYCLITPPVGHNVFVLSGVVKDVSTGTVFKGVTPFWCADIVRLAVLVAIPTISLFMPRLFLWLAQLGAFLFETRSLPLPVDHKADMLCLADHVHTVMYFCLQHDALTINIDDFH